MTFPTFTVEAEFASGTWTDLGDAALRATHRFGRQSEFARPETGQSTSLLDNSSRDFDPTYTAGSYYPNLKPGIRIRHRATLDATVYDLFVGRVDPTQGWPQQWTQPLYQELTVRANDALALLAGVKIPAGTSWPQEASGTRIGRLLDLAGWTGGRSIDTGQETIQAAAAGDLDGQDALSHAFQIADTEPGFLYVDGAGTFVFQDRHHRLVDPYTTSQATFSDDPAAGEILYSSLEMQQSRIVNVWRVTRAGGSEQVAEDSTSISLYGRLEASLQTLHASDGRALDMAQWRLQQTKDPHDRFVSMVIEPLEDSTVWQAALGLELGDRVTIVRTPPGGSEQIVQDGNIEAVTRDLIRLEDGNPSVTFGLSPASDTQAWVLGDAMNSLLGESTVLIY